MTVALVGGAMAALASPAGAAPIVVKKGQSIQAAINAAPAGSTILVKPGKFHENVWITKNNITLQGSEGTILLPPPAVGGPCVFGPGAAPGICVVGDVNFDTNVVKSYVTGVHVTGFTVKNFLFGAFAFGAQGTLIQGNTFVNNFEYGVFANTSTGTQILGNTASFSGEAGFYVGDSPSAAALVSGNTAFKNGIGVFVRDSSGGAVTDNVLHDNCIGSLFLDTGAPGPTANWQASGNTANHNNRFCPGNEDEPANSGVGIGLIGGQNVYVTGNTADDNQPGGPSLLPPAGILVISGAVTGGATTANVVVTGNHALNNSPDIRWDTFGSATFSDNVCETSVPAFICNSD